MQSFSPLTQTNLLAKVKQVRYKFEVYVDGSWIDIGSLVGSLSAAVIDGATFLAAGGTTLDGGSFTEDPTATLDGGTFDSSAKGLKSISVTPSGAGKTPEVIAGTWSAEIHNPGGIFHPLHPTSEYKDYFRIGRQVRISIGGVFGGTVYYWQRLIGYMDAPKFNHGARTVSLTGCDYSKRLADFELRSPNNYWGSSATYSTIASVMVLGSEIYAEADAMEIGVNEAGNVTNWVTSDGTFVSVTSGAGGSTYYGKLAPEDIADSPVTYDDNVGSLTAGVTYVVSFKYVRTNATHALGSRLSCYIYESGTGLCWGSIANLTSSTWTTATFQFVCPKTTTARMTFRMSDQVKAGSPWCGIDQISIKPITGDAINAPYELPMASNGPYLATLDGAAIWFGTANNEWTFDEATNLLTFSEKKIIAVGTDNLIIYYYTDQTLENVVADILVAAGLYASQALALAAMDYEATGVTIDRVWFDAGTTALAAIQKLCERVNYRFWFAYDGTPTFKPAPVGGEVDFSFTSFGHLGALDDHQELAQIRNRVVVEGIKQAMYETREDKKSSRWTGTASDSTSITANGEHTETITNDLFQDQASIDAMAAEILADRKDPKWYASLTVPHCVMPLEPGDCIEWNIAFTPGGALQTVTGIIVGVDLQNATATYTCEMRSVPMNIANYTTTPVAVTAEHCNGWVLTNLGATAGVHFDLPAAVVGMKITFYVEAAFAITIDPNGTEQIMVLTGTAGDYLASDAVVGSYLVLGCLATGKWYKLDISGTWTEE